MRSVKRWIAVCVMLAVFILPMTAFATNDPVVLRIIITYKNETISQDVVFSGYLTIEDFKAIVAKAYGSWSTKLASYELLGDHFASGDVITIDRKTVNSWPLSNASYTYTVAPDGFSYGKKPLPTKGPQVRPTEAAQSGSSSSGTKATANVTWSTKYLYQVILNNKGISFRLYGDGVKAAFKEKIENGGGDGKALVLTSDKKYGELLPKFSAEALDILKGYGVTTVRVVNRSAATTYSMGDLEGML